MTFIINDFNIYYEKYGVGNNNVLILPGWGNTRETFTSLINHLKTNNTVYILDYPGFGNSTFPNRNLTIMDYAVLIKDFINAMGIENNLTIIAHSFGGRISILLASELGISPNKLVFMDIAGIKHKKKFRLRIKEKIYRLMKRVKCVLPKKCKEKYIEYLINMFGSTDYRNINHNVRSTFINIINTDLSIYLSKINIDTLIIWGEKDQDTPIKDAKIINKMLPLSALIIIPNTNHFPYLECPILINNIITEYIAN